MASSRNFICLFALVSACCVLTEARKQGKSREARQTLFDIPFEQAQSQPGQSVPPVSSAGGFGGGGGGGFFGASAGDYGGDDSESSESSEVDVDVASIHTALVDAADAPEMVGGNGVKIGGNTLPFLTGDKGLTFQARKRNSSPLLKRTSGSSGRGVGIAFAVLGLLTIVVAAAVFTIRKYRHRIPVLVWV